jgi:hypothetical protein
VKIQGSITQEWDTFAIDKKLHPIPFHHGVAVLFVIKRHLVLQTRTAAFCDLNAQTFPGIFRLRCEQTSELPNSVVRDVNHLDRKYGTGLSKSKGCKRCRCGGSCQLPLQLCVFLRNSQAKN